MKAQLLAKSVVFFLSFLPYFLLSTPSIHHSLIDRMGGGRIDAAAAEIGLQLVGLLRAGRPD
jgi:hypothetical protein